MSTVIQPHAGIALSPPRGFVSPALVGMAALLLGSATVAGFRQKEWEFPVVQAINAYAHHSILLDRTMHALTARDLLQGVPFIALIWFLWFSGEDPSIRARLLVGTVAASFAGVVSRVMQLELPTHLRPLHEPQLGFVLPFGVDPEALNNFNSFPSDHGAVYFALCFVIWRAAPKLGVAAFTWATIVDLARVYEGYHFPSDVAGSIGLGMLVFYGFQAAPTWFLVSRVLVFMQNRRSWFYMLAFVFTFQIATLFDDVREMGRGLSAVLLHHDVFNGS